MGIFVDDVAIGYIMDEIQNLSDEYNAQILELSVNYHGWYLEHKIFMLKMDYEEKVGRLEKVLRLI